MFHIMYLSNNDKQCVTFDIIRFLIFREKNYFKFTTRNPDFAPLHVFFMQNWKKKIQKTKWGKEKGFHLVWKTSARTPLQKSYETASL